MTKDLEFFLSSNPISRLLTASVRSLSKLNLKIKKKEVTTIKMKLERSECFIYVVVRT